MTQTARPTLASPAHESSETSDPEAAVPGSEVAVEEGTLAGTDAEPSQAESHAERIVALHLLGASDRLSAQGMAAYVSGWCSALDAVDEWIEYAPDLAPAERASFIEVMRALRDAQAVALDEER